MSNPSGSASAPAETSGLTLVKEFAAAVSTQAQFANRAWLALMTIAAFAVLPHTPNKEGNLSLPFGLGEVSNTWFHGTAFVILVVLAIAFASAHVQEGRAQKLAQKMIESLANDDVHPRDLFDILRQPSFNRVMPLAQSVKRKYQFYSTKNGCPLSLRLLSSGYYGLLKLPSMVVYIGVPAWALWWSFFQLKVSGGIHVMLGLAGCVGTVSLLHVLWLDLEYAAQAVLRLWRNS